MPIDYSSSNKPSLNFLIQPKTAENPNLKRGCCFFFTRENVMINIPTVTEKVNMIVTAGLYR